MSDFIETFKQLLANYVTLAAFFCFLHICVVALIVQEWIRIQNEIGGLRLWVRTGEAPATNCAGVLHQFVEESKRWGPRGIFVPMTDFSDRLDSYVSGRLETLHSHINLFLIVGVAGTFFAMFKFAIVAAKGGIDPKLLSRALAEGISNAFPVGFIGLLLAVLGHWFAFRWEDQLRSAVNLAAQTAMKTRQEAGTGVVDKLGEILAPLGNLATTLQASLEPVIEGFRVQLNDTSKLIREQIQPLAGAIEKFGTEVKALSEVAGGLAAATRDMPASLERAAAIQQETRDSMQAFAAVMNQGGTTLLNAAQAMDSAGRELNAIPPKLQSAFSEELARMTGTAAALWTGASQQFFDALKPACEEVCAAGTALSTASAAWSRLPEHLCESMGRTITEIAGKTEEQITALVSKSLEAWTASSRQFFEDIKPACDSLTSAGTELHSASEALAGTPAAVNTTLKGALTELTSEYEREVRGLSAKSFEAWTGTCRQFVNRMNESTSAFCDSVEKHTSAAAHSLAGAAARITEVGNQFEGQLTRSVERLYGNSIAELRPHLQRMDEAISERYPQALGHIRQACEHAAELRRISSELPRDYEALSRSMRSAAEEWQKAVEAARHAPQRTLEDEHVKGIHSGINAMYLLLQRRLGQPPWKIWFRRDGDRA